MASGLRRILAVQWRYLLHGDLKGVVNGFKALRERLRLRRARTKQVACNLCGWEGPFFLSAYYFDNFRRGVFCPNCGCAERHRTLKLLLQRELGDYFERTTRRVLDVAPIENPRALFPTNNLDYVSFDLVSPKAQVHGDLTRTPWPQETFDFVLCYHVLEHIPEERKALKEIHRILRPNGLALLQVPWDKQADTTVEYPAPKEGEEGHVRRYGRDLIDRYRKAGFDPRFTTPALDPTEVRRHGLEVDTFMLVAKPDRADEGSLPED